MSMSVVYRLASHANTLWMSTGRVRPAGTGRVGPTKISAKHTSQSDQGVVQFLECGLKTSSGCLALSASSSSKVHTMRMR